MKKKLTFDYALRVANRVVEILSPFCERIEVAGSIRRLREEVGDIEIVCIPKEFLASGEVTPDLFTPTGPVELPNLPAEPKRDPGFVEAVEAWKKVRGTPRYPGRYTQRILPDGSVLDLFMTVPESWGYIFAIRTGSAFFSKNVLARRWVEKGFKGEKGVLTRNGEAVAVPEEEDLFRLLGLGWVEPRMR